MSKLVIAYAFAPDADTSAVAAVKRVVTEGARCDVISQSLASLRGEDSSLSELASTVVRRHARLAGSASFGGWQSVLGFCMEGEEVVADWESSGACYTTVYSRAHFIASHFLAALVAGDRPGLHWRAEISDPLSRKATGERREAAVPDGPVADRLREMLADSGVTLENGATTYEWAETLAYALADEVVFTSPGQRDYCLQQVKDPVVRERLVATARVQAHATLSSTWYARRPAPLDLDDDRCHIGYFGGFYASQDPDSLLVAVAHLAPHDRSRVLLHLFTTPAESILAGLTRHGVEDVVQVHDRLDFLDFLAAAQQMDLLLAVDATPVRGQSQSHVRLSKLSDYLGSRTPIWGVVAPGSDLGRQNLKWRTPLGHVTAIMQVLTTAARRSEHPTGWGSRLPVSPGHEVEQELLRPPG